MILEIKPVKACKNKAFGNFILKGRNKALITLSMKLNDTVAKYGATLLHELLHFWMTELRKQGFKAGDKREHVFINRVEDRVLEEMKRTFRKVS